MMIRINLLPVRQVKKREASRQILVLAALIVVGALIGNYVWYSSLESTEKANAERISRTKGKIAELEKVIGEVNNINKRKKELEDKLKVLDQLRKGRSGPVRMMDALSEATPKKVWLQSFDEKSNAVKITGTALSHEDVAEFMRGLANIVWTPKGMGRLVEQKRDAKTSRVELIGPQGTLEDFNVSDVGAFFTGIELKNATQKDTKAEDNTTVKTVAFELNLTANYTL
jgi:type IV pilus assembly protein PilN